MEWKHIPLGGNTRVKLQLWDADSNGRQKTIGTVEVNDDDIRRAVRAAKVVPIYVGDQERQLVFVRISALVEASDPTDRMADQLEKFFDTLADTVVRDTKNCATMANDVNALADSNHDLLEAAKALQGNAPPETIKHVTEAGQRMSVAMRACASNASVNAALARIGLK
jgi:hypothetical protein